MNNGNRQISVIVISYNGLEFIGDCLETVMLSLENNDFEVIVVDNGSVDGTVNLIRDKFPSVLLIENHDNFGFARAANQGFEIARGEFILLLNQDTRIRDRAIAKLAERIEKDNRIGTIGPKFIGFDGMLQKSCRSFPAYRDLIYMITGLSRIFPRSEIFANWKMGWFNHLEEREVDQPMGAALMIKKSVLKKIGKFDERFRIFFNDVDFCRRVKEAGYINLYYPSAVIEHYYGGTIRKMKPQMVFEWHRALSRYYWKYSRGLAGKTIAGIWGLALLLSSYPRAAYHKIFKSKSI